MLERVSFNLRLFALVLAACGSSAAPTVNSDGGVDGVAVVPDGGGAQGQDGAPADRVAETAPAGGTGTIGAAGGDLTAAGVQMTVPAGALTADVTFSIKTVTTGYPALTAEYGPVSPVYAVEPHGQIFVKPVTLAFAHTAGTIESTTLLTSSPTGDWTPLPGAAAQLTSIQMTVNHLSFFVVARRIKPNALWPQVFRKWHCAAGTRPELSFEVTRKTMYGADATWVDATTQTNLPALVSENALYLKTADDKQLMNFSFDPPSVAVGTLVGLNEYAVTANGKLAYRCTGL